MLEITIHIEATELAEAINNLATSICSGPKGVDITNTALPGATSTAVKTASIPKENKTATTAVPVAAPPQYTTEQIMEAGATLMDAGKINELMALLQKFGVQAVMDLKPEQLGPFATAMRELGAKI